MPAPIVPLRHPQTRRRSAIAALVLGLAVAAAGCGGGGGKATQTATTPATPQGTFAYDATAPLGLVDHGRANRNYPVQVRDITFTGPRGVTIAGFLIRPPGKGPYPGIVYLHGSGGNRTQLLLPALWMAGRGAVTLTVEAPPEPPSLGSTPEDELRRQRQATVEAVVTARRALDLLQAQPQVDGKRLGLVGWSAGARTGALVSGVDRRVSAFALISGGATPIAEFSAQAPPDLRQAVRAELGPVDPIALIARARPHTILLQDGRKDEVVPRPALVDLQRAAGKAAEIRWYAQAGHEPTLAEFSDQLDWLQKKLRAGPKIPGTRTGP